MCGVCIGVGNGVDGYFGGDDAGVLNDVAVVIFSRNVSNCFNDNALCNVSNGLIGGTPPNPSNTVDDAKNRIRFMCIFPLHKKFSRTFFFQKSKRIQFAVAHKEWVANENEQNYEIKSYYT